MSPSEADHYYSNHRVEMLPFIPSGVKTILEIGCGSGAFARYLKESGKFNPKVEYHGVELDQKSADKAREFMDYVHCGSVESAIKKLQRSYFDVILFNDVLEHLIDPWTVLRQLKPYYSSQGVAIASIPNVRHIGNLARLLFLKDWKYENSGILDRTHLRFFTKKSLVRLFLESGYQVDLNEIKGINPTKKVGLRLLCCASLGILNDAQYFQFALRATPTLDMPV